MSRFAAIRSWQPLPLALILLGALALRLVLWSGPLHQLANDEVEYVTVARDLLSGRGWSFYDHYHWLRAPLYPLFLAGSLWLSGGDLRLAALPNILLSVGNVLLAYLLARALVGRRAALLAAALTAILWTNATFASLYMAETLFTFLWLAALVCLLPSPPGNGWRAALLGGALLGLATLTRSASLTFVPLVALWLLLRPALIQNQATRVPSPLGWLGALSWKQLIPPAAFVVAFFLTLLPWTARNYQAYGSPILVETGLSYNMWAFNEPRESVDTIFRTLESITNPAERSDYATAKGMERLREDPAILLRKLWPNWTYLWRVKPIEDRFVLESYYLDVDLPLFVAALLFDDLLYLIIALAALAGLLLFRAPPDASPNARSGRLLLVGWLLLSIATMLVTHGEGRYRHFLFPALIPYAAWALAQVRQARTQRVAATRPKGFALRLGLATAGGALLLFTVLQSYPWAWAAQNATRGAHQLAGRVAWSLGNRPVAVQQYERAAEVQRTTHAWLRLGDVYRANGQLDDAERAYRRSVRIARLWVAPSATLGDLLRERNDLDAARTAFQGFRLDKRELLDWAWRYLSPAPSATLDVGDGLDFGYLDGVYPAEVQQGSTARWTDGRALLRLTPPAGSGPLRLRLRLAAPHPQDGPVGAEACVEGMCLPFTVQRTWREFTLLLPAFPANTPIELRSATFNGDDGRPLGLLIDQARLERVAP